MTDPTPERTPDPCGSNEDLVTPHRFYEEEKTKNAQPATEFAWFHAGWLAYEKWLDGKVTPEVDAALKKYGDELREKYREEGRKGNLDAD